MLNCFVQFIAWFIECTITFLLNNRIVYKQTHATLICITCIIIQWYNKYHKQYDWLIASRVILGYSSSHLPIRGVALTYRREISISSSSSHLFFFYSFFFCFIHSLFLQLYLSVYNWRKIVPSTRSFTNRTISTFCCLFL